MRYKILSLCTSSLLLFACSSGSSSSSTTPPVTPTSPVSVLSVVPSGNIPALSGYAATTYLAVNNPSAYSVVPSSYSATITNAGTSIAATIDSGTCGESIPAGTTCYASVTVPAATKTGQLTVQLSDESSTASYVYSIQQLTTSASTATVANGVVALLPSTILASQLAYIVPVAITQSVTNLNSLKLVDGSGNPLTATAISGNNSSLQVGNVVTFLVNLPLLSTNSSLKNSSTLGVAVEGLNSGGESIGVTATQNLKVYSGSAAIINLPSSTYSLSESKPSQTVTLYNSGNVAATNLAITKANSASPVTITNNCGSSLAAGSSCSFVATQESSVSYNGTAIVNVAFNNGVESQTIAQTFSFTTASPANLAISGVATYTTTNSTAITKTLTLTNNGNQQITLGNVGLATSFGFALAESAASNACTVASATALSGNLAVGSSCTVNLVYTPVLYTNSINSNVTFNYTYSSGGSSVAANTSFAITYTNTMVLADGNDALEVTADQGASADSNAITITNDSDAQITAVTATLTGVPSALNGLLVVKAGSCDDDSLAADGTCTITLTLSPAAETVAGDYSATVNLSYIPYVGGTTMTVAIPVTATVTEP